MSTRKGDKRMNRRHLWAVGGAMLAAPVVSRRGVPQGAQRTVLPSYGGSYEDMMKKAFAEPFGRETGIQVAFSAPGDLARLRAQVMAKRPEGDLFEATGTLVADGSKLGLSEPLDPEIVTETELINGPRRYHATFYRSVAGIAWNETRHNAGNSPGTWMDFWDVARYAGRRSFRNRADMALELALVADGVDPARLYPLDVDRASGAPERIKPAVAVWSDASCGAAGGLCEPEYPDAGASSCDRSAR